VYCIAYQKNTPFFFRKTIQSKADTVTLLATTTASLQRELSKIDLKNNVLQTEISFQRFLQQNDQKLKSYRNIRALKRELKSIVFPCKNPKKQIGFDVYFQDAMPVRDIIINEGEN
jgi:pyoverdine/dityrosine biosynthesis protein Dit1